LYSRRVSSSRLKKAVNGGEAKIRMLGLKIHHGAPEASPGTKLA
jgi:hypothetical protein